MRFLLSAACLVAGVLAFGGWLPAMMWASAPSELSASDRLSIALLLALPVTLLAAAIVPFVVRSPQAMWIYLVAAAQTVLTLGVFWRA